MDFNQLKDFLARRMKMSHVYQPVMIRYLLTNDGFAHDTDIAREISQQDPTQIEYYRTITNNMVGRVLRNHGIVERVEKNYVLKNFSSLSSSEIDELIEICTDKLEEYLNKRGSTMWEHRSKGRRAVSGTIKYEVLKRAHFRCELCGSMDAERALEVDHIIPKNMGGADSINNYQALCYSCNTMKRDTDSMDFRGINEKYRHREDDCVFCNIDKKRIVDENNLAYLVFDKYPVTAHHALIVPNRHFADYFDIYQPEINAIQSLLHTGRNLIKKKDTLVSAFNIGINTGEAAGQTIFHCHLHLIPRRDGDVADPVGGVRNIILDKGNYIK